MWLDTHPGYEYTAWCSGTVADDAIITFNSFQRLVQTPILADQPPTLAMTYDSTIHDV